MNVSEFDYDLPSELIAQEPARPRDSSRLLVLHRDTGAIEHRCFRDVVEYVGPRDVVVLNDTRVIRARLRGRRVPGGGKTEVLLLEEVEEGVWEALVTPGRRVQPGRMIEFGDGELLADVVGRTPAGGRLLRFSGAEDLRAALATLGEMPLPPYVHSPLREEADYQTVYSREPGAAAAPTAGLHFTPALLEAVRARAHALVYLTLHIGLSTFRPMRAGRLEDHQMHSESYSIPEDTATIVTRAAAAGLRILAVGTSTARALEASALPGGGIRAGAARTDLFIRPGYRFRVLGALLTNFHMPRSTLLVMVSAFAGRDKILRAYREAIDQRYRFLSFGDAMLIL
jgi:S-adenosylmethionine:tRNA ribosyltransferase-isomerase